MRPLTSVGVGLALVVLDVGVNGYDLVADPVGWLLVVVGCQALPATLRGRGPLLGVALVAGLLSLPLWFPGFADRLGDVEESLLWALDLPQVAFLAVLALTLSRAADAGGDLSARGWWRLVLGGTVVMVLLPPLVFGAGAAAVLVLGVLIALGTVVTAICLCLAHRDRPWVQAPDTAQDRPS